MILDAASLGLPSAMALLVLFKFLDEVLPDEEVALHKHTANHISICIEKHVCFTMYALHTCGLRKHQLLTSRAVSSD